MMVQSHSPQSHFHCQLEACRLVHFSLLAVFLVWFSWAGGEWSSWREGQNLASVRLQVLVFAF